ncbi:MAG: hypothetical protein R3B72_11090 [Polyangiaceae bacterium]
MRGERLVLGMALAMALGSGGACGSDGGDTTSGKGGSIDWSGSGGSGGNLGTGGLAGTGGEGATGAGSSTSNTGGMTGSGGDGGTGAGGPASVVAIGVGPSSGLLAAWDGAAWTVAALGEGSAAGPAIAAVASGEAAALFPAPNGTLRRLAYTSSGWGSVADLGASTGATTPPRAAAGGHFTFLGENFLHYYAAYGAVTWSPAEEAVLPSMGAQSFGPSPAGIARDGSDVTIAFAGNDGALYTQTRSGGQWQGATMVAGSKVLLPPALIALSGGDALLTWVNEDPMSTDHTKIMFSRRTGSAWSSPAIIDAGVFTQAPIAATALPADGAVVVYRGSDGKAYSVRYAGGQWGLPFGVGTPSVDVIGSPAVAPGASGGSTSADAEMCFVGSGGDLHHTRLMGTAWSSPEAMGGSGLTSCAVATIE